MTITVAMPGTSVAAFHPSVWLAPASIDGTGNRDVTAPLQQFFDGVPDGSVARLRAGSRYRVEGTLVLSGRVRFTLDGRGSTIFATTRGDIDRSSIVVRGGRGVTLRRLVIKGANAQAGLADAAYQPSLAGQHGVRLEGAVAVEIDRVAISDVYGDFVYVGPGPSGDWSRGVYVHDSLFSRSGRQGISVTAGRAVLVERNIISDVRRSTIDLEPNSPSGGAYDVQILDNQLGRGRLLLLAAGGAGPVNQVVFARNLVRGHILNATVSPPEGTRRRSFFVIGNLSDTPGTAAPLRFTGVDGLVVRANRQPVTRSGEAGVTVSDSCALDIAANDFGPTTPQVAVDGSGCPGKPPPLPGRPDVNAGQRLELARRWDRPVPT